MEIHPSAVVSPTAELGRDVRVGPLSIIEDGAVVGDGCDLAGRVTIKSGAVLGKNNRVYEGAVIGGMPQHVRVPETPGRVLIGDGNTIRENVTIHRALDTHHNTVIGDGCLLMVSAHIAHDCHIGNQVIIANNAMLAGHVTVEDRAYLSGAAGVHQFCRVGSLAMVGGQAHVVRDVPPFVTVDGLTSTIVGLNRVGLKRAGYTVQDISQLKAAYRLIYRSGLPWTKILDYLAVDYTSGAAAKFLEFFSGGTRGFTPARRTPSGATLLLHAGENEDSPATQSKVG